MKKKETRQVCFNIPVELDEKFNKACIENYTSKTQALIRMILKYVEEKE